MQVIFTGGPYDSMFRELNVDQNGVPKPMELRMPAKVSVEETPVMNALPTLNEMTTYTYRLEVVPNKEFVDGGWRDSVKERHYEYVYQGR